MKQGKKHKPKLVINATADEVLNFALKPKKKAADIDKEAAMKAVADLLAKSEYHNAAQYLMTYFVKTPLTDKQLENLPDLQDRLIEFLRDKSELDVYAAIDSIVELAKKGAIKSKSKV